MDITFYTKTKDAWERMLHDLESAQQSIDIEQYIFVYDGVGEQFLNILRKKAEMGVRVRMILDMVGSYRMYNSGIPDELRTYGIQIHFFNPIRPWRIANFTSNFFRDHRKIMLIDGKIAHVGGVGIEEKMAEWRDTHMRIVGPLVLDIKQSFEITWKGPNRWSLSKFRRVRHFVKKYNFLTNVPVIGQRYIYQALILNFRNAQKYIYITSPYFIPDRRMFRILRLAARRGVDVRIIVPEIADHLFVDYARESFFARALQAGVKIYQYKEIMMHTKACVVDDTWATTGSFNIDRLSFFYNHESNVASSDQEFIAALKQHFYDDIGNSEEVIPEVWYRRPLTNRFLELLTLPIHWIM